MQWFTSLASVLASAHLSKAQELMTYLFTIVRCHREFIYDKAFKRHAEGTQDLKVNASLFNLCFTGRAKKRYIYHICLNKEHQAERCPESTPMWPTFANILPSQHAGPVLLFSPAPQFLPPPRPQLFRQQVELCQLFNARAGNKCAYPNCRYARICKQNGHRASNCLVTRESYQVPGLRRPHC